MDKVTALLFLLTVATRLHMHAWRFFNSASSTLSCVQDMEYHSARRVLECCVEYQVPGSTSIMTSARLSLLDLAEQRVPITASGPSQPPTQLQNLLHPCRPLCSCGPEMSIDLQNSQLLNVILVGENIALVVSTILCNISLVVRPFTGNLRWVRNLMLFLLPDVTSLL